MNINTKDQINLNISTISTILENIQFKANNDEFDKITESDNQIIR